MLFASLTYLLPVRSSEAQPLRLTLQSSRLERRPPVSRLVTQHFWWRRRVGIEPTQAASRRPATGLKPARTTRPPAPPRPLTLAKTSVSCHLAFVIFSAVKC